MQKYILVEGLVVGLPCIKVVSANNIIVDIAFKISPTYVKEVEHMKRKFSIE